MKSVVRFCRPRRVDLEQRALSKLRRLFPGLRVRYESATSPILSAFPVWNDPVGNETDRLRDHRERPPGWECPD